MAKRRGAHPFLRDGRWWGDFREYQEEGGRREPLVAPGTKFGTTDRAIADVLFAERLKALEAKRRGRVLFGEGKDRTLAEIARLDLIAKSDSGKYTDGHLTAVELRLRTVFAFLGGAADPRADRLLAGAVTVEQVRALVAHLRKLPNGRGGALSEGSVRHHLNALSAVYRHAAELQAVPPGFNPVAVLRDKPVGRAPEARWLEPHEAALLLEAARRYVAPKDGTPFAHALVGFFLLTGCRETEAYGVELDDVSFERETITIRPNRWRRLKTRASARVLPLWPQLAEILREYLRGPHRPTGELLFPSWARDREAMLSDSRKLLDHLALRAGLARAVTDKEGKPLKRGGWPVLEPVLRTKAFRHTYCAARLQTLDRGAPVALDTVRREMGHSSVHMVEKVYGHLGQIRHRAEAVEFRPELLAAARFTDGRTLAERVQALQGADGHGS